MHYATLKAEFITPCFCGGADQSKPELRTQSIRGQLRWWYRICGATRDEEAELFGSTEKISPLTVRIANVNRGPKPFNLNDQNNELSTYLWYFLTNQGRECLPVKTSFDLELKSREKDLLEKGVAVTALWISLGALGSRSTRAAGCMRLVTEYAGDPSSLWRKVSTKLPLKNGKNPPFELYKSDPAMEDGLDAARWLAKKWRELRSHETPSGIGQKDHDEASDLLLKVKKSKEIKVRRVVLGMPYTQGSQKGGSPFRNKKLQWKPANGEHFYGTSRLASPVHLRPIYKNGKVYPALLIFQYRLSDCPNYVYANRADEIKVDQDAAINEVKLICTKREIQANDPSH